MNLPIANLAVVDPRKVADYLLNAAHPDNGGKARFFEALGYAASDVARLVTALRTVAETGEAIEREESQYGEKYVVDGLLVSQTEGSRFRAVRTVWIIERGLDAPSLVTAYPGED